LLEHYFQGSKEQFKAGVKKSEKSKVLEDKIAKGLNVGSYQNNKKPLELLLTKGIPLK
jgi:hypothetical protein